MRWFVTVSRGSSGRFAVRRPLRDRTGRSRLVLASALSVVAGGLALVSVSSEAQGATTPAGFSESVVFSGLTNPTVVRFSPDGRVFVAEKRGVIKVFDSLTDPTPDVFADLNANVHNFWDRGLLGMALDPGFPANPYIYVLYTYDHELGSAAPAPRWGTPGVYSDTCPTPPGATADGCVVSGRLTRLTASGNTMTGSEQVLVEDWCQQYPSHSIGSLEFGRSGALYASGGDGAVSYTHLTLPMEWLGYCWHQSSTSTCSDPVMVLPLACNRDSRPLTTHPSAVAPGGLGQGSEYTPGVPHLGAAAADPSTWS